MEWIKASDKLPVRGEISSLDNVTFRRIQNKRPIVFIDWGNCTTHYLYISPDDMSDYEIPVEEIEWLDEDAPPVSLWVDVEKELPDINNKFGESEYVLCLDEYKNQFVGWYNKRGEWIISYCTCPSTPVTAKITHWQKHPTPPLT